jgi:hypothetical protein
MNTSLHRVVLLAASLIQSSSFRIFLEKRQKNNAQLSLKYFLSAYFEHKKARLGLGLGNADFIIL